MTKRVHANVVLSCVLPVSRCWNIYAVSTLDKSVAETRSQIGAALSTRVRFLFRSLWRIMKGKRKERGDEIEMKEKVENESTNALWSSLLVAFVTNHSMSFQTPFIPKTDLCPLGPTLATIRTLSSPLSHCKHRALVDPQDTLRTLCLLNSPLLFYS